MGALGIRQCWLEVGQGWPQRPNNIGQIDYNTNPGFGDPQRPWMNNPNELRVVVTFSVGRRSFPHKHDPRLTAFLNAANSFVRDSRAEQGNLEFGLFRKLG